MTIEQLKIELDLNAGNAQHILEKYATSVNDCYFFGYYFFVDDEDGRCYLFNRNGEQKDIHEVVELRKEYISRNIKKIAIPDSVTEIRNGAFAACTSLTSISIPDSVTSIGYSAFAYCTSLKSISIPDSVTKIRKWAFAYCTSLKSISIPDSMIEIGGRAFAGCTSLENISIPDSMTEIGYEAFYKCISLKNVIFKGKTKDEVRKMDNYPWEIEDISVIKCI